MFPRWLLLCALGLIASSAIADERWWDSLGRAASASYRQLAEHEAVLREELKTLPQAPGSQQSERLGWHSQFARTPNATKWLQIDLGRVQPFEAVAIVPVDVAYGTRPGPGFGFPLRFRVEVSDDAAFSEPRLLAAFDEADFPNPGNAPVYLSTPDATGRFIRMTATRLWPRDEFALVALGEIFVLHDGLDVAAGAAVTVSDAYNNPPTWEPMNATDGESVLGAPVEITAAPGNGYHAQMAKSQDVTKWVQVDLGAEMLLDEVRVYPARPKDFPARRGFGFPPRFRVEASNDADFASPMVLLDQTQADFVNPAENPVIVPVHEVRGRYVRMTATKLWERTNDYIFALAELEVYSGGKNVALGAEVTALDGIDAATWKRRFLVDGFNSQGRIVPLADWLRGLSRRREIEQELDRSAAERSRLTAALGALAWKWTVGSALVLVLGLAWWVQKRARARRRELEMLRQRIAGDLHDEIGSNLGSIALLSQMALRQSGDAKADLAEINRVARETAASMRDIVWLIKPDAAGAQDFAVKLRETAAVMLAGLDWEFDDEALTTPLSLEWKRQILLIFKEALHNIRRHAEAHRVSIHLTNAGGEFVMRISDDGKGFNPEAQSSGYGLNSQRQRAQTLGGEWRVESKLGQGTVVILRAKMRSASATTPG